MYRTYNYTNIKIREKRVYSISGTKISSFGVTTSFLKVFSVVFTIFNIIGIFLCFKANKFLYNPIISSVEVDFTFLMIFIALPFGISILLNNTKIQNYKLIDYIFMYLKPKETYDIDGRKVKFIKYSVDSFVEKVI